MRQLAAIMFTDMVGFTALMQADEARARAAVARHRDTVRHEVERFGGEVVQFYGDGTLNVFRSAVDAADCAIAIQSGMATDGTDTPLRIGLHTGDVVRDEDSVFGDGVNVAARIQSLGVPGSVLLSAKLRDEIKNQTRFHDRPIGSFELRNVVEPMEVYALTNPGLRVPAELDLPSDVGQHDSVAVLPFVNMSADPDNEYFADGVSEEVINVLTRIPGLKVTARTSSFAFKGRNEDVREIGRQLGVAHVLEGSVRRAADRVRVTAQLIKTRDGYHLFSEVYDRGLEDIFATQDDIAGAIADALRVHLGSNPRNQKRSGAETRVPEAYEHYLQGLHRWNEYTPQGARASLEEFRAAAEADPEWAPPVCMEAAALTFLCSIGYEAPDVGFPLAEAAADRALELAPALGEAHMGKALVQFFYHWDFDAAEESFERALSLQPGSANVLDTFSMLRLAQGRWDEALALMERAVELNPLSPLTRFGLARSLMFAGRVDDAMAMAEAILKEHPGFRAATDGVGWCRLMTGDIDGAIETWESLARDTGDPYNAAGPRGVGYAKAGRREDAHAMLDLLEQKTQERPGIHTELDMAMVNVALGEVDRALDYLEQAFDARLGAVVFMPVYHIWRPLHSNPRFRALLDRAGLEPKPVP